ncbi:MAG: RNA-binding protein [Thalassobaculum sp.]|uniref:RNA-binding protein n=1 Tax=Thalassobaculum sp. TaxID=2022740 RepID=UPI0032F06E07
MTRESGPRGGLVRFVVGPDDEIVPDVDERLPGRGIWVTADRAVLERAVEKRLFGRGAKQAVRVDPDLADRVEALLARRCIELLALARRAGSAVAGLAKVRQALETGRPGVLLEAADGAEDGRARLRALAGDRPVVATLTAAELAGAFGREHTVHGFVDSGGPGGGLADRLRRNADRLVGFRGPTPGPRLENPAGTCIQGAGPLMDG